MTKPPTLTAGGTVDYTHARFYVTCSDGSTPGNTCPECARTHNGPRRMCDGCVADHIEALHRRTAAALRLPPLESGYRDPWTGGAR